MSFPGANPTGLATDRSVWRPDYLGRFLLSASFVLVGPHHPLGADPRGLPQALRVLTDPADCGPDTAAHRGEAFNGGAVSQFTRSTHR
jgi:hypothetical protein